jgi:hypothetical protein
MIFLRDTKGKRVPLSESIRFVEICDLEGRVAKALILDDQGTIRMIDGTDAESLRYAQTFKVTFCKLVELPDIPG